MLEPHLSEIKHQGESKLQHPESLAIGSFSMPLYTEKTDGCHHRQMPAPNLPERHLADQTNEYQESCCIVPATPGINQRSTLGRLTPPSKKKLTINKELKTSTQHRGWGKELISVKTFSKQGL
jgi:hypothetical protein